MTNSIEIKRSDIGRRACVTGAAAPVSADDRVTRGRRPVVLVPDDASIEAPANGDEGTADEDGLSAPFATFRNEVRGALARGT